MPAAIPAIFTALMVGAIFLPFIPLAGPLSADDILPLASALLGLAVVLFSRRKPLLDGAVVGFALLALVGLLSNAANAATFGDFLRLTGRSTGRIVYYVVLIVGTRTILDRGDWPRRALLFLVGAATLEALFCLYAFITDYHGPYGLGIIGFPGWSVLVGKTRVQGTFSGSAVRYEGAAVSANFLAAYLILTIPLTVGLMLTTLRRRWRLTLGASALLQVAILYLTYTRSALMAFGFSILAMGFLSGRRKIAGAVLVAGIVAALSIPTVRTKLLGEGHDRWSLYWASFQITHDRAALGVGDGNYNQVLMENRKYRDTPYGLAGTTSHNSVLLSAANYGVLGGSAHALLYLLMIAVMLRVSHQTRDPRRKLVVAGVVAGILGYLFQDQFNNLAYVPKVATQMWFLYALVPLLARPPGEQAEEAEPDRVVRLYPMTHLERG